MEFEWDAHKAEDNAERRGVTFEQAREVFDDPDVLIMPDEVHSTEEDRSLAIGVARVGAAFRVLTVAYTMRDGDTIRIISARLATSRERRRYDAGE